MDTRAKEEDDRSSDYGSDFTVDEEGILNNLLSQLPDKPSPDLVVKDIEDDETPGGIRLLRALGRQRHERPGTPQLQLPVNTADSRIPVEIESDGDSTTNGKLTLTGLAEPTDRQAPSPERPKPFRETAICTRLPISRA